jgi:site-specific DNA-methyltransferase (adenine-specific)
MIDINKNYNESNLETMAKMPDCFVDLTVTSPPYDDLRTYNGYCFDFENVAKELYRITKDGGVVTWIVNDKTEKGSETGTSFRQALYFKEIGFNLWDTMIWRKTNPIPNDTRQNRYIQSFEYMFIFSKGKPKTCNYLREKSKCAGLVTNNTSQIKSNGDSRDDRKEARKGMVVNEFKILTNIWDCSSVHKNEKTKHPAQFPEQLANDHIVSWSNEGNLVYDPFMGSGTVAKMSILNNRNWIGSEISSEYCNIIEERIKKALEEKRKEKDLQAGTLFGDEM